MFIGAGWTNLVIEIFIMAIAASAANFMTGYAGLVSFGLAGCMAQAPIQQPF